MENKNFIGVGGLVVKDGKYLLVRHTYGEYKGLWIIPGGHVKKGEHIDDAVEREVFEETSVIAKSQKIIAVRSRVRNENCTDCYLVFQMEYVSGTPTSDNYENDAAEFFSIRQINRLKNIVDLAQVVINQHYEGTLTSIPKNTEIDSYYESSMSKLFM